ncbi:hypothetical protein [Paracoccus tegillarcae]|uniref:Uncharacterized protein n=1 Tax=Paracoccus tegillarcae TaxID=1529068 RepID=A0A2K9EYU0_9RHOB|nr:hypothetical protein [Paracoccus tegillarcae]AUH32051.1 hypothetical protein CUV01_00330 [Paracoccus tegillarcae]
MLIDKDRQTEAGGPAQELADLIDASKNAPPEDYLSFLTCSNGGQGGLSVQPLWLFLHAAACVAGEVRPPKLSGVTYPILIYGFLFSA